MTPFPVRAALTLALGIFLVSFAAALAVILLSRTPQSQRSCARGAPQGETPYEYSFNVPGVLNEAPSPSKSSSRYWFVSSGGKFIVKNGMGSTIEGDLPETDPWYRAYARSNPVDTDGGLHPQNIFRIVTESAWQDAIEEAHFFILADHFSASPNRNASNGLFLMSRYCDQDTLYYAGVRVDGMAVIKKKYHGTYYTLAHALVFPGTYATTKDENLLPHEAWIGLRFESVNRPDGSVALSFFVKRPKDAGWQTVLNAVDNGSYGRTPPLVDSGRAGIRTDFMDVRFRGFTIDAASLRP